MATQVATTIRSGKATPEMQKKLAEAHAGDAEGVGTDAKTDVSFRWTYQIPAHGVPCSIR